MNEKKMKPQIEIFRNGAIDAYCPECMNIVYNTWSGKEKPNRCPHCDTLLDWTEEESEEEIIEVQKYYAVAVENGKTVEGYPVIATSGKTYMMILMDDAAPDVRFMYAEIYPQTLAVME